MSKHKEAAKVVKCQICGEEMVEGSKVKNTDLYICRDCETLISSVVHDCAYDIFTDITHVMGEVGGTWEERLESWMRELKQHD